METVYTLGQIKDAWAEYSKTKALRTLVKGKWKLQSLDKAGGHLNATKAAVVKLRDHISFPVFLEKIYHG